MNTKLIGEFLRNPKNPLKARFRALFVLKNLNTPEAVELIGDCFTDESDLLKHELAYCLGQMQREDAIPILEDLITDTENSVIVRHEAGEALGAIGTDKCSEIVANFINDDAPEVAETCSLALSRISQLKDIYEARCKNPAIGQTLFVSVDPAFPLCDRTDINELGKVAANETEDMYLRYAAMFQLRNINTRDSVLALTKSFNCKNSALLRHEIAFILGQMQHEAAIDALTDRLVDVEESPMVRHECAEALGAIGTQQCKYILERYLHDPERIVRESCEVALDICEYEMSNDFEYANGADIIRAVSDFQLHENGTGV